MLHYNGTCNMINKGSGVYIDHCWVEYDTTEHGGILKSKLTFERRVGRGLRRSTWTRLDLLFLAIIIITIKCLFK